MTLLEGIEHLEELIPTIKCEKCRVEHEELLRWLNELFVLRAKNNSK